MTLTRYETSGYDRPKQRELAAEMNIVLDFLSRPQCGAYERIHRAITTLCDHIAMHEEIREEGDE